MPIPIVKVYCACGREFDTYFGLRVHQGHAARTTSDVEARKHKNVDVED